MNSIRFFDEDLLLSTTLKDLPEFSKLSDFHDVAVYVDTVRVGPRHEPAPKRFLIVRKKEILNLKNQIKLNERMELLLSRNL